MSRRSPYLLAASLVLAGLLGGHVVIDAAFSDPAENPLVTLLTGRDWPVLSHLLTTLPALLALIGLLVSRRTLAVPVPKIGVPLALLGGLAWSSTLFASNRSSAILGAVEWSAYGLVFFAVVAGGGRSNARMLLGAIAIGGTAAAALAIRQYGEMKGFDPGFRAQGPWNNPNAVGAYLGIALVAALSLVPTSERVGKVAALLGAILIGLGLALTQSRGAYVSTAFGIVVWIVVLALARSKRILPALGAAFAAVLLAALMTMAATRRPESAPGAPTGGGAFTRLGNSQEASVQSLGFRRLLWRSAIALTREDPLGDGLNSYGPRSSKPGLVTGTQLAHSTPLQLSSEISPIGAGLFVVFFGIVGFVAFRGVRHLDESRKGALAGAAGALAGALAHNLFDSDAYYFGLGLTLFALAGILLLAGSDTSAPELVPSNWRWAGTGALSLLVLVWIVLGQIDRTAAVVRGLTLTGEYVPAQNALAALDPVVDYEGRLLARKALLARNERERLVALDRAAQLAPSPRNYRSLAAERLRQGDLDAAIREYENALELDPNNFPALTQLRKLYESRGSVAEAEKIARRTVAIETTPYYTVRSQPELVPTATADARVFLAGRAGSSEERTALLVPALEIYRAYAATTVPVVVRFDDGTGRSDYAGETRARAGEVVAAGRSVVRTLREQGYRETARLDAAEADFSRAEGLLRRDSSAR